MSHQENSWGFVLEICTNIYIENSIQHVFIIFTSPPPPNSSRIHTPLPYLTTLCLFPPSRAIYAAQIFWYMWPSTDYDGLFRCNTFSETYLPSPKS